MQPTIEIDYYQPYFEDDEILILQGELSSLGPLRVREVSKELGGDEANLWIIIQWFGVSVASGLIQHVTAKFYEKITAAISNYRRKCKDRSLKSDEAINLTLSFDDLDININLPAETTIELLPQILLRVRDEIENGVLKSQKIVQVYLPYYFDDSEELWRQSFNWVDMKESARYWGIQSDRYTYRSGIISDIYDSKEHRLVHAPFESIFDNVI